MPFQQLLGAPVHPYFRVSRDQGNSYFLLFTGMTDPLLDTKTLEYWECHIYIYVPHGTRDKHQTGPRCILRNQKLMARTVVQMDDSRLQDCWCCYCLSEGPELIKGPHPSWPDPPQGANNGLVEWRWPCKAQAMSQTADGPRTMSELYLCACSLGFLIYKHPRASREA